MARGRDSSGTRLILPSDRVHLNSLGGLKGAGTERAIHGSQP